MTRRQRHALALLAFAVVVGISLSASAGYGQDALTWLHHLPAGDVVGHFFVFGGLAAAVTWGLGPSRWRAWAGLLTLAALVDEVAQLGLPNRTFAWTDLGAGLAGIWLAAWAIGRRAAGFHPR